LIAEGEKMKLSLAALVALALANVSGEASAQVVEARLDGWLCRFFNAPDASLLAEVPAYGLGPLRTSSTTREASGAKVDVLTQTVQSNAVTVTFRQSVRASDGDRYGFRLMIEATGASFWPDRARAEAELSRVGNVRYDAAVDDVIAEDQLEPGGEWYHWTASFDVRKQRLQINWLQPGHASSGRGFCD
jgi:hypothetical protein